MWQQVLREAGARTVPQQLMWDMDLAVTATDGRQLDVVAYGLPMFGGMPICGDATLVSPLDAAGQPKYSADDDDGQFPLLSVSQLKWPLLTSFSAFTDMIIWFFFPILLIAKCFIFIPFFKVKMND